LIVTLDVTENKPLRVDCGRLGDEHDPWTARGSFCLLLEVVSTWVGRAGYVERHTANACLYFDSSSLNWYFNLTVLISARGQSAARRRISSRINDNRSVASPLLNGVLKTLEFGEAVQQHHVQADRVTCDHLQLLDVDPLADPDSEDGDVGIVCPVCR